MKHSISFPKIVWSAFVSLAVGHILFLIALFPFIVILAFHTPRVNMFMMYRALRYGEHAKPIKPVPLSSLPKALPRMLVLLEDHNFYTHHGIDLTAISEAAERNKKAGPMSYGASTITQQLSRTLFLTPQKSYFRKYLEVLISLELDAILPKERIMELYINEIEWGGAVYGIHQAALGYYGTAPGKLTRDQCARLSAIIISPRSFDVNTLTRHPTMSARYRAASGM